MKDFTSIILLLLSIIVAINYQKIGELTKKHTLFGYALLLCMILLLAYIAVTVFNILKT